MLKKIGISIFVLLVLAVAGFVVWANNASAPQASAMAALKSDDRVKVTVSESYITFEPLAQPATTGFIFYPGGRVDYRAYAPVLRLIAEQGYFVAVPQLRLNLAIVDIDAAQPLITAHPEVTVWAVGGHSLGGVAAASFAASHPTVSGLVFWAGYPADDSLKSSKLKITSIYGTLDGLDSLATTSKELLPADTTFVVIEGGNHAQFGDYGPQEGDNPASISAEAQWQQTADATLALLASLGQ